MEGDLTTNGTRCPRVQPLNPPRSVAVPTQVASRPRLPLPLPRYATPVQLLQRLSIRVRLFLLAGVPVVGAFVLAAVIAQDARHRATSAEALGSVEELASLSSQMSATMFALQTERARAALDEGASDHTATRAALTAHYRTTDSQRDKLEGLLARRDLSKLPPRLSRELSEARLTMGSLAAFRDKLAVSGASIDEILDFYGAIDESLIAATAALAHLSDDGEILRNINALVAIAELAERVSAEHALLANVSVRKQFAPGTFKKLITMGTEAAIYRSVFRANAPEDLLASLLTEEQQPVVLAALSMRDKVLASTDDNVELDTKVWFETGQARLSLIEAIATAATADLSIAATRKVQSAHASIRLGIGLSVAVVIVSLLLALVIRRGISRSITALSRAAAQVQASKDFSIRADKHGNDELGMLADAFNEMLADVQTREAELGLHRNNLATLVRARTKQLAERNGAMRVVLDNVEQGIARVDVAGAIQPERSARFDQLLGQVHGTKTFAEHLGAGDPDLRDLLELGWESVRDGIFPIDVALDQLPKRMVRDGKHFTLGFRPIVIDDQLDGALLVVTDVTAEVEARREEEKQREQFAVFQRVTLDRQGYIAFSEEMDALLDRLAWATSGSASVMDLLHTIKGNAAQWGVSSVARLAHVLETQLVEVDELPTIAQRAELVTAWMTMTDRFRGVLTESVARIELSRAELESLLTDIRAGAAHDALEEKVARLNSEPAAVRFQRMEDGIHRLAARLGKKKPRVVIEAEDVRLSAARFNGFWSSLVHVVRNMVDHGLETAEVRTQAGKGSTGRILLRATENAERITIECADDGAGIDWAAVAVKACAADLPFATPQDLEAALFARGISTAEAVTDISGRGAGLAAVLEQCQQLGGTAAVSSTPGRGARFVFTFAAAAKVREPQRLLQAS